MNDKQHLTWMYYRLITVYGENKNTDYMIRFKSIIEKMPNEKESRSVIPTDEEVLIESVKESARRHNAYVSECREAEESYNQWRSKPWIYRMFHDYKRYPRFRTPMSTKQRIIAKRIGLIK